LPITFSRSKITIAKTCRQVWAAIAHNIQKGAKFLRLYDLPEPVCAK
jgi:hypothetical protein